MLYDRTFEIFAEYCETYSGHIPMGFILGFYVSVVVNRFWQQLNELPWPHRVGFFVSAMMQGNDDRGRMLRRTIMRYLTVSYILTMKDICPPVRKRFPTLQRVRDVGRQSNSRVDASITYPYLSSPFVATPQSTSQKR